MAITITKQPSGIYPAYNDSFVQFTSDVAGNSRAEITALPTEIFSKPFSVFPDLDGVYTFNLKEIAKTILNGKDFEDKNYFEDAFYKSISGLYLLQNITIEVFAGGTSETITNNYEFFKSVKQIEEVIFSNPFQILSNSKNGIDYNLTYFEGFPFAFDIQRVIHVLGKQITVKNVNTGLTSSVMTTNENGAFRFNVDKGDGSNWTASNFLPLMTGINKLEIYEDGIFKTNLALRKRTVCNGIYLKWFNADGGYNTFLFQEYFTEEIDAKDIDFVGANEFLNVGELDSSVKSIGKQAARGLRIRAKLNASEIETIKSLYVSPLVQMYTSKLENVKGKFINVGIEGKLNANNKLGNNEIVLNVVLPEMITAKL